jgi:hypothetical protein
LWNYGLDKRGRDILKERGLVSPAPIEKESESRIID